MIFQGPSLQSHVTRCPVTSYSGLHVRTPRDGLHNARVTLVTSTVWLAGDKSGVPDEPKGRIQSALLLSRVNAPDRISGERRERKVFLGRPLTVLINTLVSI